jgi:hypothetical protein
MRAVKLGLIVGGLLWAASALRAEEFKDAKIVKIAEKLLVTFEAGGKQHQVTAYPFLKGFGTDGKQLTELGHGVRVLKEGNVLDLKTESMKLTGQAQMYISEARLKKGELQSIEVLRSIATPNVRGKKSSATSARLFTVVKAEPRRAVVLRGADGEEISAFPSLNKATDATGEPLPADQLQRVLRVGNVLEVTLGKESNSQNRTIKEARLVSGELVPLAASTTAAAGGDTKEYRGVVLKKFGIRGSAIELDGKEIAIGPWQPNSAFYGANGKKLEGGPDILGAIKAGSVVDIKLGPPPPKGSGATLLEIKLIRAP